jgi:hypothetical protein
MISCITLNQIVDKFLHENKLARLLDPSPGAELTDEEKVRLKLWYDFQQLCP